MCQCCWVACRFGTACTQHIANQLKDVSFPKTWSTNNVIMVMAAHLPEESLWWEADIQQIVALIAYVLKAFFFCLKIVVAWASAQTDHQLCDVTYTNIQEAMYRTGVLLIAVHYKSCKDIVLITCNSLYCLYIKSLHHHNTKTFEIQVKFNRKTCMLLKFSSSTNVQLYFSK